MNIKLTKEQKIRVLNEQDVVTIMQQVLKRASKIDRNKEHFWIVCLDAHNQILLIELISLGTITATLIEPVEVFSFALQKRAVQLILVHNHPSGVTDPSDLDYQETERMVAIGKFINVPVTDHIIISEVGYYSFSKAGLMRRIEKTTNIDLTFAKQTAAQKDIARLEEIVQAKIEQAESAVERTALNFLKNGVAIEIVVKSTGLTLEEVEKLIKK